MTHPLQPYRGGIRKLVIGIDVGTTFSGVAYAILDPGEVPRIQSVTRFPGQENAASDTKIPSIIYYRPDGTIHSIGAEAALPGIDLQADDEELIFVEWRLHLRPQRLDAQDKAVSRRLPPLPSGKNVVNIFSDFLSYLFACTRTYIHETHGNGEHLWHSLEDRIEFVLSHPNGWEGLQQSKMQDAAVSAKLVPDTTAGHARLHFVTEGEASLNFCIRNGLTDEVLEAGNGIMIVDAGGGTVDVSSYSFQSISPISVEEVAAADCIVQGSTQIDARAKEFLTERLAQSRFGNDEDIKSMLESFSKATKPIFRSVDEVSYIKFGSRGCNDPAVNIRRGQLMLTGQEMESLFEPARKAIVKVVQTQRQAASYPITAVFLVGGFAASPWLFASLNADLETFGLALFRPDAHTSKAVAEGAVSFYLDRFVSTRVMRATYGVECTTDYNPLDQEHVARRGQKFTRPSGRVALSGSFSNILAKGICMREGDEVSHSFFQEAHNPRTLNRIVVEVLCYRGKDANPQWLDVDPELYIPLCTIAADTSRVLKKPKRGQSREVYYAQEFDVVLICGYTQLKAQIRWYEDGVECRGPANIIYDEDLQITTTRP
ncbi:hypothetical protein C8Q70DRAFT_1056983 [Cubamyces menziesii]|nr:hypothetical protein C8Q70DRAFT_1056983 [Cubamyces menziesii]